MESSMGRRISDVLSPSVTIGQLASYLDALEAEKRKIEPLEGDIPLCMLLLDTVIASVKAELARFEKSKAGQLEDEKRQKLENDEVDVKNWMSSVQLGNSYHQHLEDEQTLEPDDIQSCKNRIAGTTLWPLKWCTNFPMLPAVEENEDESNLVTRLSLGTTEANNHLEEMSSSSRSYSNVYAYNHPSLRGGQHLQQITKKRRRCWSPDLHNQFVDALEKLGGAQAATPKQIRELMGVEGLSNDEVKSHLQKYRFHTRRVASSTDAENSIVLGASGVSEEQASKQRNSGSGSPQGHTHLTGFSQATSLTGGESVEEGDDGIQLSSEDINDDAKMERVWL